MRSAKLKFVLPALETGAQPPSVWFHDCSDLSHQSQIKDLMVANIIRASAGASSSERLLSDEHFNMPEVMRWLITAAEGNGGFFSVTSGSTQDPL